MISGEQLILTRQGLHVSNKTLESIGIYPDSQVYMLPFQTYEYRETEPAYHFPMDLLVTPIPPKRWPFVMRFQLRLRNRPESLHSALNFFQKYGINILYSECTRSGHHHTALNLLGEVTRLELITLSKIFEWLKGWKEESKQLFNGIYDKLYDFQNNESEESAESSERFEFPEWWTALETYVRYFDNDQCRTVKDVQALLDSSLERMNNLPKGGTDETGYKVRLKELSELEGELLAAYAREISKKETPIENFLEIMIEKVRPKIFKIEMEYGRRKIPSSQKLYSEIEKAMILPKLLLSVIISFKRVLCEKYKILIINDSLSEITLEENRIKGQQSSIYLYNIKYFDYVYKKPLFCEPIIFKSESTKNAREKEIDWRETIKSIFKKVRGLDDDRKSPWSSDSEARLDLDPVLVTPVESLCHASYHRAYEDDFECKAADSMIPFPDSPNYPDRFLGGILPPNSPATIAVASINSNDLTLRLCPLPVSSLNRFLKIELSRFNRNCLPYCKEQFIENQRKKDFFFKDDNTSRVVDEPTESSSDKGTRCEGNTVGLLSLWTEVIRDHNLNDEIPVPTLNIWRAYNKTFKLSETAESGSIHVLALATDNNFKNFPDEIDTQIGEKFRVLVKEKFPSGHLRIDKITKGRLSGGKVFVSLPFSHPMSKEWLQCVKDVGHQFGFTEVDTVETYTEPITDLVANRIKNSNVMIQILALPIESLEDLCQKNSKERSRQMIWLFAEYLTAITNKLKVARIVDESTIDEREFQIGRDHASFRFSVTKPFSNFEDSVKNAFAHLRKELVDVLGLG